jgi:hypothetical protein
VYFTIPSISYQFLACEGQLPPQAQSLSVGAIANGGAIATGGNRVLIAFTTSLNARVAGLSASEDK